MNGWLGDVHLDRERGEMVAWTYADDGEVRAHREAWRPVIHVAAEPHRLHMLESSLAQPEHIAHLGQARTWRESARLRLESQVEREVLAVEVADARHVQRMAKWLDAQGDWCHHELFSVDAKLPQRWLHAHGLHPFGRVRIDGLIPLDTREEMAWPLPPMRIVQLYVEARDAHGHRTARAPITHVDLIPQIDLGREGPPRPPQRVLRTAFPDAATFLAAILDAVDALKVDILRTEGGDTVDLPALHGLAEQAGVPLRLGRTEKHAAPRSRARTAWSYGRLLRKEAVHALEGRLHIDMSTSFITKEGGFGGLFELARLSGQSAQDLARLSPGSAISAMQMRQAMEDGVLVPWKKNRPEDVKTGTEMIAADRGGMYLEPVVGVHRDVVELDFASRFPSIIVTRNTSPDTLGCACCVPGEDGGPPGIMPLAPGGAARIGRLRREDGRPWQMPVPELQLHSCTLEAGFLGRVVAPIIARRVAIKAQRRIKGDAADLRQNALKWVLVTCFGYTGYRNARFGRIECHEAICAWAREILLQAKCVAEAEGWTVLHAIVDSMWMRDELGRGPREREASIRRVISLLEAEIGIPIDLEDVYRWIAFIPNRTNGVGALTKYFAIGETGEWKVRGIELRQHSTCPWVAGLQQRALDLLGEDPGVGAQREVVAMLHRELGRLRAGDIPLTDLIVARRVTRERGDFKVATLTLAAIERAAMLGRRIAPGHKARFAVIWKDDPRITRRVRLAAEIDAGTTACEGPGARGDASFYTPLAVRAIHAILVAFGWEEVDIVMPPDAPRQRRLNEWLAA